MSPEAGLQDPFTTRISKQLESRKRPRELPAPVLLTASPQDVRSGSGEVNVPWQLLRPRQSCLSPTAPLFPCPPPQDQAGLRQRSPMRLPKGLTAAPAHEPWPVHLGQLRGGYSSAAATSRALPL